MYVLFMQLKFSYVVEPLLKNIMRAKATTLLTFLYGLQ